MAQFLDRYRIIESQKEDSVTFIKDLLVYIDKLENDLRGENQRLLKELEDAQLDLDDARRSRREMQQQLTATSQRLGQYNTDNESLKNRNPYIIVLVDGDGTIFHEEYIRQGLEGGKKAANALRNAALEQCPNIPDDVEVIAKIFANVSGLAKAMKRVGVLDNPEDLREFTLGFTQGKASFDFIDVGHGKERADSKIREATRWNIRNHNCKQILLGVSHDAGYAPFLDEILRDDSTTRRVSIIEGTPIVRELAATGTRVLNFDHIFRNDKLIERQSPYSQFQQLSHGLPPSQLQAIGNGRGQSPTPPNTWAGVTSIPLTTPPPMVFPVTLKNGTSGAAAATALNIVTPHPKLDDWVPGDRGLDPILTISAIVLERTKRRAGNTKLCNNHYLRGPCPKGDECVFEHKHKATEEELKAIAYLTRLNPCVNGQDCDVEYCIYGHHCPSVGLNLAAVGGNGKGEDGVCAAFGCRFGADGHPPGTVIRHPKKWDKEYY
ncbi:hypothetical protein V502_10579 [Pseudogymnoascus sp. VKM F-4520 (FW-2644)]|nr:hypothetical protein V502_10579 [Pseudogymnoascus sp. VKM F-4520 (FW-2644)]